MPSSWRHAKKQPRKRFHREFWKWLLENEPDLAYPLTFKRRTQEALFFSFEGLTPILEICIGHDIGIYVLQNDEIWDALLFFEGYPIKTTGGYECTLCLPEFKETYSSRETLWIQHVFEPFREWIQNDLRPAQWLMLGEASGGGITWAELHSDRKEDKDNQESKKCWIPLQAHGTPQPMLSSRQTRS